MKKILSIMMSVLIVIGMFTFMASASDSVEFTLKADKIEADVGEIVTLTVTVPENSMLCAVTLDVVYDSDKFEVVSATEGDLMPDTMINTNEDGKVKVVFASATNIKPKATEIVKIEVRAVKGGSAGFELTFEEAYISTPDGEKAEKAITPISNKVVVLVEEEAGTPHVCNYKELITKEVTCTEDGAVEYTCEECGDKKTETIPALGHTYGEPTLIPAPSCRAPSTSTSVCANCGDIKVEIIPALPHEYGEITRTKEPTCSEEGEDKCWCINCNAPKVTKIPTLPHTPGDWIVEIEPTETEKGLKLIKCTECNVVLDKEEISFLSVGDINGDGVVSAIDVRLTLQIAAEIIPYENYQYICADIDGNGEVTAVDVRLVLQMVAGIR